MRDNIRRETETGAMEARTARAHPIQFQYHNATMSYGQLRIGSGSSVLAEIRQIEFVRYLERLEAVYTEVGLLANGLKAPIASIEEGVNILLGLMRERSEAILIQNLRNPHYRLMQPIPVTIKEAQNEVVARYEDAGLYGSGEFRQEAINDLCESIVDYYETLSQEQGNLGPLAQAHWDFLKNIIQTI